MSNQIVIEPQSIHAGPDKATHAWNKILVITNSSGCKALNYMYIYIAIHNIDAQPNKILLTFVQLSNFHHLDFCNKV